MKTMKKALHVLLALAVVCMLTIPAFAATPTYAITISNTNTAVSINNNIYSAYKLFNVSFNASNTAYSYSWDNTCLNVTYTVGSTTYKSGDGTLLTWLSDASRTDSEIRDFADFVYDTYINVTPAPSPSGHDTASGESATIDVTTAGAGYYLVYGTGTAGTTTVTASVSLTTTDPTATVHPKLDAPTLDKQIKHNEVASPNEWGVVGDNQIGDTVEYRTITTVPDTTNYDNYIYVIHDTMTSGLTFNNDVSIKVNDGTASAAPLSSSYYSVDASPTDSHTFDVTVNILGAISAGVLKANDKLTTYYTATLNEHAVIYTAGHNDNTAYLQYSNNPYDNHSKGTTPPKTVYDWTFTMGVNKVDNKTPANPLTGATFVLSKSATLTKDGDGNITNAIALIDEGGSVYRVAPTGYAGTTITIAAGSATIGGLDDATTYYLHETVAPAGYNLKTTPTSFIISASYAIAGDELASNNPTVKIDSGAPSSTLSADIINSTGLILPGTGGIGTRMFYAIGGTLTASAGIVLVARKRVKNEK